MKIFNHMKEWFKSGLRAWPSFILFVLFMYFSQVGYSSVLKETVFTSGFLFALAFVFAWRFNEKVHNDMQKKGFYEKKKKR